jgi:DUF4097 and DUF4098 domain-containing protein YvlB
MQTTKTATFVSSILLAFTLSVSTASEEKFNRETAASPGGKLVVDVNFGNIELSPGNDAKVAVEAFRSIDFGDEAREKEYLAAASITMTTEGNTVTLRARGKTEVHHIWPNHTRMDARYTIRVPKNFSAELNTGGGAIAVSQLTGDVRADSGGGDLRFSHLRGGLSARSGGGAIRLEDCDGTVEITTGGGDILLSKGNGKLRARTGGGRIEVHDFKGDTDVTTGGGQLTLEGINGAVDGQTGGGSISASFAGDPLKKITLESSGGDIDLALPKAAAADIAADTGAGRVTTDLPLDTTSADDEHLRGKLNGGGPSIRLRTTSGSIRIRSTSGTTASR